MSRHNANFQLTPIEQNGLRQYKRVAIVLPLLLSGNDSPRETLTVEQRTLKAFLDTLAAWPFLWCSVRISGERKLTMLGTPSTYDGARSELRNAHTPPSIEPGLGELGLLTQLYSDSLSADFFRSERELNLVTGMPPVMIKLTFLENLLVVGFSFYEAVVDGEFISRFFSWIVDSTWIAPTSLTQYIWRRPLQAVQPAEINRDLFSFYDWSNSPLPQYTPKDRLVCRLIEFKKSVVLDFIDRIRRAIGSHVFRVNGKDEDYIVAMLWAAIMHARFSKLRFRYQCTPRINILLPGEPQARRAEERDWCYFGSSTVPTVAELSFSRLLFPEGQINSDYGMRCAYSIRGIAEAASVIRQAIRKVDHDYVRQLMGLKESLQPSADWAAYERAIDRHTTGMVFEDWRGYWDNQAIGLPYTTGQAVRMLPCADDKEEGKVVLLPQLRDADGGNEIGWTAWVCLDVDTWPIVLKGLGMQGWILGERADANVNTGRSS